MTVQRSERASVKAIETAYAGHRFRSRLEARWAVFFDHAGIPWQYEPQGYDLGDRGYLPDFQLYGAGGPLVEVKGDPALVDYRLMQQVVLNTDRPLILLGEVPDTRLGRGVLHSFADAHGSCPVQWQSFVWRRSASQKCPLPFPLGWQYEHDFKNPVNWLGSVVTDLIESNPKVMRAYGVARAARFEHGETPARPR